MPGYAGRMIDGAVSADTTETAEAPIRAGLARADAVRETIAPILRHLLASENASVFSEEIVARVRADGATLTWSGFGWYDDRAGADPISSDPGDLGGGFGVSFTFDRSTTEATLAATAARLRALARPFAYRGAELPARPRLLQRLGLARPRTYLGVDLADW